MDIREKELLREKQKLYREELERQKREAYDRIIRSKNAASDEERRLLESEIGSIQQSKDKDLMKERQKKEVAMNIMDENIRLKQEAVRNLKDIERREAAVELEKIKRIQAEEQLKNDAEKNNKLRIANALRVSYDVQENMKKQEFDKLKELDKEYCEKHKQKLIDDEKYRQIGRAHV